MALSTPTQWEVRSGGSDTLNGGGFNPGSANFITDWAVSSANTASPVVTSVSYSFVAGDVGAKFFLQAGTNGIPGWYTIASVNAGAATLTASVGSSIKYDSTIQCNGLNTVVGCGTSASLTSQTGGIDYTQQNAVQFNLTAVTTAAANAILLTASAANSMLGQVVQITAGTNFTTGFYEVTAVSVGVSLTVDRTCTTAAGSAGVVKIGGALATIGKIGGTLVAGNSAWGNGSFTLVATDSVSISGTVTNPIFIRGYGTYRGDGYLGRTSNVKGLITTNMPLLAYNSTFRFNTTGTFVVIESLRITSNNSSYSLTPGINGVVRWCSVSNSSANTLAGGIQLTGAATVVDDCDISNVSAAVGAAAVNLSGSASIVSRCHITSTGFIGATLSSTARLVNNLIYGCANFGVSINATSGAVLVSGNTIVGCTSDGINIITGTTSTTVIEMNCITDNGGYGLNMVSTSNFAYVSSNFFRNNTSGAVGNAGQMVTTMLLGSSNIQATTGAAYVDYTDQSTGDYSLKASSGAAGTGQPYAASVGAFQRALTSVVAPGTNRLDLGGVNPYVTLGPVVMSPSAVTDTGTVLSVAQVFNSSGGGYGISFRAATTSAVEKIWVYAGSFVGTAANTTLRGEIRNMTGAQNPGTTVRQAAVTATWANQSAGHWAQFDFSGVPYSATQGENLFLNMFNTAGVPATDYPKIVTQSGLPASLQGYSGYGEKYCYTTTAGWSTATNIGKSPVFVVKYADGTYDGIPFTKGSSTFYSSGTLERGTVVESLDAPAYAVGAFFYPSAAISLLKIYQGNAAAGSTTYRTFTPSAVDLGQGLMMFSSPVLLSAGVKYRSVVSFGSAAQIPAIMQIESSTDFAGLLLCGAYGNTMGYSTIDNGSGGWTDDKSAYGGVVLIISQFPPVTGNGLQSQRHLTGGIA